MKKINKPPKRKSNLISFLFNHWERIFLGIFILTYTLVFGYLSIKRHDAFASGFDLANMDQTVWNTLNGRFFSLSNDGQFVSRFAIHADLILVFLTPLYFIWNNVRMLLIAQTLFLALGAIPVYLLAGKQFKEKLLPLVFTALYLLLPGMQWTNIYDFHGVALAIPFLLFAFYFANEKKWLWYGVFAVLSLLTKEEVSLTVFLLGIYVLFFQKQKKYGLITMAASFGWFMLSVFVLIPQARGGEEHIALNMFKFSDSQQSASTFINFLIQRFLFEKHTLDYYLMLFKQTGFLPLLGFPWLIFAAPQLFINVLSNQPQLRSIILHYDSVITPWLIVSSIFGIKYIQIILKKIKYFKKYAKILSYLVLFVGMLIALRTNYHYSPLPTTPGCWCYIYQVSQDDLEFEKLLAKIPESASVTSSPEIRPHINHRINSYTLPVATDSADFIAIIDQNRIIGNYDPKDFELRLIEILNEENNYKLVDHIGHFYLFQNQK